MKPIKNSYYSDYFKDFAETDISVLDSEEAKNIWSKIVVGKKGRGFYDSQLATWLDLSHWQTVGRWLEPFNSSEQSQVVINLIADYSQWFAEKELFLIKDSQNIITFRFKEFSRFWVELLSIFDDGPLLVGIELDSGPAFRFAPLGHVMFKA